MVTARVTAMALVLMSASCAAETPPPDPLPPKPPQAARKQAPAPAPIAAPPPAALARAYDSALARSYTTAATSNDAGDLSRLRDLNAAAEASMVDLQRTRTPATLKAATAAVGALSAYLASLGNGP